MSTLKRLRADLRSAIRTGEEVETSTIRTLISAIENAGAIEAGTPVDPQLGLNHDRARRELTESDVARVVERERAEVSGAAASYRGLGLTDKAAELERRADIVDRYLHGLP